MGIRRRTDSLARVAVLSALLASLGTTTATAQLASRRLAPPGTVVPGRLSATNEAQPLIHAIPDWRVGALTPYVNLFTGNLFLAYRALEAPAIGFDWDLSLYYNSRRASETGSLGKGWRHSYETTLLLNTPPGNITVAWGDGRRDVFTWTGSSWAGPASLEGRVITNITGGYRLATKHGDRMEFNSTGRLIRLIDRNANTTTLAYSGAQLASITDPTGRQITFTYNGLGRVSTIGGLVAQPITLTYVSDRLTNLSEAQGFPFSFQYDGQDRLVRIADAQGRLTHVDYYGALGAVQWARSSIACRKFLFNSNTLTTVVRDSVGVGDSTSTAYHFNADGTTQSVLQQDLPASTSTYDPSTLGMLSHTDPNGRTWSRTLNALGDVLTVTDPTAGVWTWTYDPFHLPSTLQVPGGALWQWGRDGNGNLTSVTDPMVNAWGWTYDSQGLVQSQTDPNFNTTSFGYDGYGNCTLVQDPAGGQRTCTYDDRGNLLTWNDQLTNQWSVTRDGRDGVTQLNEPGGNYYTLEWWPDGTQKNAIDAEGAETRYVYDAVDRLVRAVMTPDSTTLTRDGTGAVKGVQNSTGDTQTIERDGAGRPKRVTDSSGNPWENSFDGLDARILTLPSGAQVVTEHDAWHRPKTVAIPGDTTTYDYDALDRLIGAKRAKSAAPIIDYRFFYNPANQLVQKETRHLGRTVNLTKDAGGRVSSMVDNLSPIPWDYTFNSRDLITGMSSQYDVQVSAGYTARLELGYLYVSPPGAGFNQTFDATGYVNSLYTSSFSIYTNFLPLYSTRHDMTSCSGYTPSAGYFSMSATYNPARQVLTENHSPGGAFAYNLDGAGNRLSKNRPGGFELYNYLPGHRLSSAGLLSQSWNVNGDVVGSGWPGHAISMTYRPDRSLATLTDSGSTWRFVPGPFGEIAAMIAPTNDTTWYDTDTGPAGVLRRSTFAARNAAPTAEYGYLPPHSGSTPRFKKTPGNVQALLPGLTGITEVVDNSGLVSSRYYSLFGELLATTGTPSQSPGFADMDVLRDPFAPLIVATSQRADAAGLPADVAYLPRTGSYLRDLGLGPDFLGSVGMGTGPAPSVGPSPSATPTPQPGPTITPLPTPTPTPPPTPTPTPQPEDPPGGLFFPPSLNPDPDPAPGDPNDPGKVDPSDYLLWPKEPEHVQPAPSVGPPFGLRTVTPPPIRRARPFSSPSPSPTPTPSPPFIPQEY